MKTPKLFLPMVTLAALVTTGGAAEVIKANNTNNLNLGSSWALGSAPGSSDVARWDGTVTSANSTLLGGNLSWQGILITSAAGGNVAIGGASNTLTLGSSGISTAKVLTLSSLVALNADQTWSNTTSSSMVVNGATVTNNGYNLSFSGQINIGADLTGTGGLTKNSGSTLTISGDSTYTGTTTINAGILQLGGGGARGSISNSSSVTGSGRFRFFQSGTTDFTIANTITGSLSVDKYATNNTAVITGANSYTGKTAIAGGGISVSSLNSIVGGSATSNLGAPVTVANGTIAIGLNTAFSSAGAGTLIYTGSGETTDRVINLAGMSNGGVLSQSGSGVLKFTSDFTAAGVGSKTLTLQGSTAGSGEIAGAIGNNNTLGSTNLTAAFSAGATVITLGSVDGISIGASIAGTGIGAGTTVTAIDSATKTVTLSAAATGGGTFGQTITVVGVSNLTSIIKDGTGTWTLSGNNTYTGNTIVNSGVLGLSDTSQTKFTIGASGVNNQILGSGTVLLDGAFSFDLTAAGTGMGDSWTVVDLGSLNATFGSTFNVAGFTDLGNNLWSLNQSGTIYQFSESTGLLAVVPEPSAIALGVIGLASLAYRRRRSAA